METIKIEPALEKISDSAAGIPMIGVQKERPPASHQEMPGVRVAVSWDLLCLA